ncbi:MAG: hypothetical protein JWM96_1409, partial [Alphaproteobacteria bacterium]|nr:hypothetical protein [Alphaproteobacteria bacterium]
DRQAPLILSASLFTYLHEQGLLVLRKVHDASGRLSGLASYYSETHPTGVSQSLTDGEFVILPVGSDVEEMMLAEKPPISTLE